MYNDYFRFSEPPFSVTPDPRFFYSNSLYQEVFASLVYGIKAKKGFIVITGEVGTGKTTLLRKLMRNLEATIQSVLIFNTYVSFEELLQLILQDLSLTNEGHNRLRMTQTLNEYLLKQAQKGGTLSLLIDEAQNLSDEALEGLRLLSNLETDKEKLIQIVLMGQPELDANLNKFSLRQLKQRIALRCRLDSLKQREVGNYISHRLHVAGYDGAEIFSKEAVESVWRYSRGTPRLINILCDSALLVAYASNKRVVSLSIIEEAAQDLQLEPDPQVARLEVVKPGAAKQQQSASESAPGPGKEKVTEVIGTEVLRENRAGLRNPSNGGASVQPEPAWIMPRQDVVSGPFLDVMSRALVEAMGPMAPLILREKISVLGESPGAFPMSRLGELVELAGREIWHEKLKVEFRQLMFDRIREVTGAGLSTSRDIKWLKSRKA